MARFILIVFPLYIVLGRLPNAIFYAFMTISALLLGICTILFANWFWVG